MRTSARNELSGTIKQVKKGAVNGDVILDLGSGRELFANITNSAIDILQLAEGKPVTAIVHASSLMLSPNVEIRSSARNKLIGTITDTKPGAINTAMTIAIDRELELGAVITNTSVTQLGLREGTPCCVLIKASDIMIAVDR